MKNNETFGISVEKTICMNFNDINNKIDNNRCDITIMNELKEPFKKFFIDNKITKLEYTGDVSNKTDFIGDNKTYSVKSNLKKNDKVCPQNIGQTTKAKFIENIYNVVNNTKIEEKDFDSITDLMLKENIINNADKYLNLYLENLFCCDYIIYIQQTTMKPKLIGKKDFIFDNKLDSCKITFTRDASKWNESTTVKYNNISIGEFQFHKKGKHKGIKKFRFHLNRLLSIIL